MKEERFYGKPDLNKMKRKENNRKILGRELIIITSWIADTIHQKSVKKSI